FYHDSTDIGDPYQRMVASHRLVAKMPTLAAMAYKYSIGQPFIYPRNDLDYPSKLPADVLRGAVRALRGEPDRLARARPHSHAARGSRAERLHVHGAARRLVG